ncbi:MAG: 4'-phosphopantetheinyl transferase superfamily protein [Bacteroidota bacterium]
MIGFDLVHMPQATFRSESRFHAYVRKVATDSEEAWVYQQDQPQTAFWHLWAWKEAAFKVNFQSGGKRVFAPKRLQAETFEKHMDQPGWVIQGRTERGAVQGESSQNEALISAWTMSSDHSQKRLERAVFPLSKAQSLQAGYYLRKEALTWLENQFGGSFRWEEHAYFPTLIAPSGESWPASLSHHGPFGGLACVIPH